jgi:hypothetical protein
MALTVQALVLSVAIGTVFLSGVNGSLSVDTSYVKSYGCTNVPPAGASWALPVPREGAASATDVFSGSSWYGLSLVFGGETVSSGSTPIVDQGTWEFQNGCWASLTSTIVGSTTYPWSPCGYGTSYFTVATSCPAPTSGYYPEPVARFGAMMTWDNALGVFLLFGGCTTPYSTAYPDLCSNSAGNSGYNILSDTWAFTPGSAFGTGTWSLVPSATCSSTYAYPYGQNDAVEVTTYGAGIPSGYSCQYVVSAGSTQDSYCDTATYLTCYFFGVYGGSMTYDPDTSQCANGGSACVLLYGGADQWSQSQTTDFGPCAANYYVATDHALYCSDELWELNGNSLSTLTWVEQQFYVTSNVLHNPDPWGHYSNCWTSTTTVSSPALSSCLGYVSATNWNPTAVTSGNGLAYSSLTAPGCTAAACTLVLTGGVNSTNSNYGELVSPETWYLTGSVNGTAATWSYVIPTGFPASEWATQIYDPASASFHSAEIRTGGISTTGRGYSAVPATIWYFSVNPGSAPSWTSSSVTAPDDILGAAPLYDTQSDLVVVFGGWDWSLSGSGNQAPPSEVYVN